MTVITGGEERGPDLFSALFSFLFILMQLTLYICVVFFSFYRLRGGYSDICWVDLGELILSILYVDLYCWTTPPLMLHAFCCILFL
jgi:hypothetical protein